jgi:peptidoglycan/LPS O-acetylase OafA/YrhL
MEMPDFLGFWRRRLHRLYTPYLVTLCLCMVLVVVSYSTGISSPLVDRYPEPRPRWIAIDFLAHLGMLHGLHPILDRSGGNAPLWTLAREEYFYLMYFPLLWWRRQQGLGITLGCVLALGLFLPKLMALVLSPGSPWWWTVNTSSPVLWIQWCLGMVSAEAYHRVLTLPSWCGAPVLVFAWAGAALVGDHFGSLFSPLLWGMTFFTLINYCIARERANRWPRGKLFRWMSGVGVFSYSLYLIHYPIRAITKRLLGPFAETANSGLCLVNVLLISIAGYVAGILFFHAVERRFLPRSAAHDPTRVSAAARD